MARRFVSFSFSTSMNMFKSFIIVFIVFVQLNSAVRRRCLNSGVLFPDKISNSPVVVFGESLGKRIYLDNDIEQLFNVTFRVDCLFKGQEEIEERIEITQAGIKTGHTSCQQLEPGKLYIVFLEKWGTNSNGYRPVDFQERPVDSMTYELLEKTCHLKRQMPLHSTRNSCPNVSRTDACPHDEIDVNIIPKEKSIETPVTKMKSSYFNNANQFYLQSNVTIPIEVPLRTPIADRTNNAIRKTSFSFLLILFVCLIEL